MAADSLTKRNSENSAQTREETRSNEKFIRPAVNIIETEEGLVLTADIPGATKESLDVNVEKGILTISAPAQHKMHGTPTYREFVSSSCIPARIIFVGSGIGGHECRFPF